MLTRRTLTVVLVGLNLVLALALVLSVIPEKAALAAPGRSGGGVVCVTAKAAGQSYDVVYLLDSANERLYALYPTTPQISRLSNAKFRDMKADFGS